MVSVFRFSLPIPPAPPLKVEKFLFSDFFENRMEDVFSRPDSKSEVGFPKFLSVLDLFAF